MTMTHYSLLLWGDRARAYMGSSENTLRGGRPCCARYYPLAGRKAFTLVELLVVIGIIGLLLGILLPALSAAQAQSRFIKCAANIRSQVQAHNVYSITYHDFKPPLYRKGTITSRIDYVSPDVKWNNEPVGQGILVAGGLLPFEVLLDPSEAMQDDAERDQTNWRDLPDAGSSYAYYWRHPASSGGSASGLMVTYLNASGTKKTMPLVMDLNAAPGHQYLGEYAGRTWISHPKVKRANVGYSDGSVVSFALDEVRLEYPGRQAEELIWVDAIAAKY
jgi:prepilin-type N-terminal cleavage/methylation domain-containing protein